MGAEPKSIVEVCAGIPGRAGFILRPWTVADSDVLVAAWNDPEIARWNPVPPNPTVELARSWIRGTAAQNEASIGIDVVMVDQRSGEVAGEIGQQVDPSQAIGEVGFWLAQSSRGKGRATTLLSLAQDLAGALELAGMVALVEPENEKATAVLQVNGWPELPTKSDRRAFAYRVHLGSSLT